MSLVRQNITISEPFYTVARELYLSPTENPGLGIVEDQVRTDQTLVQVFEVAGSQKTRHCEDPKVGG